MFVWVLASLHVPSRSTAMFTRYVRPGSATRRRHPSRSKEPIAYGDSGAWTALAARRHGSVTADRGGDEGMLPGAGGLVAGHTAPTTVPRASCPENGADGSVPESRQGCTRKPRLSDRGPGQPSRL